MLHCAAGPEDAAVAGTMEALIALKVRDCASEVSADRAGHCKTLIPVAKDEDLLSGMNVGGPNGKSAGSPILKD